MTKLTKNVFLAIFGTAAAMVLYFVLFGVPAGNIAGVFHWTQYRGAIYYAARFIETPISRYYYEYSYIPNFHANDYVDEALGGTDNIGDIYNTPADLSWFDDGYTFTGSVRHWSTGWQ